MSAIRLCTAPETWGVELVIDPAQVPWPHVPNEVAAVGFEGIELGPYGYVPTGPQQLATEMSASGLKLSAGFIMDPCTTRERPRARAQPHRRHSPAAAGPAHRAFGRFPPGAGNAMSFDDHKVIEASRFSTAIRDGRNVIPTVQDRSPQRMYSRPNRSRVDRAGGRPRKGVLSELILRGQRSHD